MIMWPEKAMLLSISLKKRSENLLGFQSIFNYAGLFRSSFGAS